MNSNTKTSQDQVSVIDQLRQAARSMRLELDYPLKPTEEWVRRRYLLLQAIREVGFEVPYGAPPSQLLAAADAILFRSEK